MNTQAHGLLVVEDDPELVRQLRWSLEEYAPVFAETRERALAALKTHAPAVVLQDLGLPPDPTGVEEGMRCLQDMLAQAPETKIIVATGNGDAGSGVRATGLGAWDFYQKPLDLAILRIILDRAFRIWRLEREYRALQQTAQSPLAGFIATSRNMLDIVRLTEKVAPTRATILIHGETGTGKEIIAGALHRLSGRGQGRFIAINCAAIPENLLESELFGYEKGAFTGAVKQTPGKIESADQGTLFLDEIGDMPLELQAKLLRFLQERVVERLGAREEIPVDVRIVCATHQDLKRLIEQGRFREDLFYRVCEIVIEIPPLRERNGDAVLIAQYLLQRAAQQHGRAIRGFTPDALLFIETYSWPGNVRELENRVNRAVILAEDKLIGSKELGIPAERTDALPTLKETRDHAEHMALERALRIADGNLSRAAELLCVSRPTLYDLLKRHQMTPD